MRDADHGVKAFCTTSEHAALARTADELYACLKLFKLQITTELLSALGVKSTWGGASLEQLTQALNNDPDFKLLYETCRRRLMKRWGCTGKHLQNEAEAAKQALAPILAGRAS